MNKILNILKEVAEEAVHSVAYFAKHSIKHLATLIKLLTPYLMYVLGQKLALDRGMFAVGGEVFIPVYLWLLAEFIESVANKLNRGPRIPKPTERFTEVDEDGMVSVEEARVDELLIYVADLEDWMERKGWL